MKVLLILLANLHLFHYVYGCNTKKKGQYQNAKCTDYKECYTISVNVIVTKDLPDFGLFVHYCIYFVKNIFYGLTSHSCKNADRCSTRTLLFGFTDVPYFISVTVYHDQFHIHKFVNIFFIIYYTYFHIFTLRTMFCYYDASLNL